VHETFWVETKTRPETHVFETETRQRRSKFCPRQDVEAPETLSSLGSFNVSPRRFLWIRWNTLTTKKLYGLINLHHGKLFLFVILWVFALYFDNYHWIINGLHHKELQLQCCRHEPLCLLILFANCDNVQLIIALYVVYFWLIVFILTSYTLSSLRLGHFMTKKDWHAIILLCNK